MNYCGHCGTRLAANGLCPSCSGATAATGPAAGQGTAEGEGLPRIVEQTSAAPPPPPPFSAAASAATSAASGTAATPRADQEPTVVNPTATLGPARLAHQPTTVLSRAEPIESWDLVDDEPLLDDPQSWRRSQLATVGVIATILLLAGLGVVLWNLLADEPDSLATVPTVSTTVAPETTVETESTPPPTTLPLPSTTGSGTLPDLTPMTIPPTVATFTPATLAPPPPTVIITMTVPRTVPPATAPPGPAAPSQTVPDTSGDTVPAPDPVDTVPPETLPPETQPPQTAPPPPAPASQRGNPQYLQDPMPSGLTYGEVAGSHGLSQQLADALALEQWGTARALSPALAGSSDATLAAGYGGLDRASLLLVDSRPEGDGYRLLIVSIANELGFSRTSLYCFEWTAQPGQGTVRQGGGVGRIAQVQGGLSPDEVRSDPNLSATIRNACVWS